MTRSLSSRSAVALGALMLIGCSDLTKVEAPDLVQRPGLTNAAGAVTFFNGAVTSFYGMFVSYIETNGLVSDELTASSSFISYGPLDRRTLPDGASTLGSYSSLQQARINSLQALGVLRAALPTQRWRFGQMFAQIAYTELLIAEVHCSGAPLGTIDEDFSPRYGQPLTSTQLLQQALADFDSAAAYSTDSTRLVNLALVGRARTLLDLNQPAAAATAAAAVPTSFQFITEHTAAVRPNGLFTDIATSGNLSVADREGGNGLPFTSGNDPRIAPVSLGRGADGGTPLYRPGRLVATTTPNILANGIEARLIEAEALLRAGDAAGWLAKLNNLRSTAITPAMAALTDPGTADSRLNLHFAERAYWLFLAGHRLGDLRRLVRQYGRAVNTLFPVGPYKFGGNFGDDIVVPVDQSEFIYNPYLNGKACLDRNP